LVILESAEVGDAITQSDVVVLALYLDVLKFFIPSSAGSWWGKIGRRSIKSVGQTAKAASEDAPR